MAKVYVIEQIFNTLGEDIIPQVVGYTSDKELLNRFISERKMELYRITELKGEKNNIDKFKREYKYSELADMEYYTKNDSGFVIKKSKITILSTWLEQDKCMYNKISVEEEMMKLAKMPYAMYKEKYIDALNVLGYVVSRNNRHIFFSNNPDSYDYEDLTPMMLFRDPDMDIPMMNKWIYKEIEPEPTKISMDELSYMVTWLSKFFK